MTLACEDANSKLVEVVTVADVDGEDHVGNSLLQIWELTFGQLQNLNQTKLQNLDQDSTLASKSCLNFNFKISTKHCAQSLNKILA